MQTAHKLKSNQSVNQSICIFSRYWFQQKDYEDWQIDCRVYIQPTLKRNKQKGNIRIVINRVNKSRECLQSMHPGTSYPFVTALKRLFACHSFKNEKLNVCFSSEPSNLFQIWINSGLDLSLKNSIPAHVVACKTIQVLSVARGFTFSNCFQNIFHQCLPILFFVVMIDPPHYLVESNHALEKLSSRKAWGYCGSDVTRNCCKYVFLGNVTSASSSQTIFDFPATTCTHFHKKNMCTLRNTFYINFTYNTSP